MQEASPIGEPSTQLLMGPLRKDGAWAPQTDPPMSPGPTRAAG
jgi:hypothetical protein